MKKFLQKPISVILAMMLVITPSVFADDYEPADEPTNSTNEFILDADDTGGDISIQFGETLGEFLKYDAIDLRFELSDPLSLEGNELEDFRIENLSADPACTGGDEGRVYYNTVSDTLLYCDGSSFGALGGAVSEDQTNLVYVDGTRTAQVGEVYNTLAAAVSYVGAQSPGAGNRWVIMMEPGTNTESVTIPTFTTLIGRDRKVTTLTGTITLLDNSVLQSLGINTTGEVDINSGEAYITDSDVILGDGAAGGITGTIVSNNAFISGDIDTGGALMAYHSVIGADGGLINDGTIATYQSTVLSLTNNNFWNNFGVAYNNSTSGLTATNTQAAIDELRTSNTFTIDSDDAGSDQVQLNFGTPEFLLWDDINDYFFISDALVVDGNVNLQGTVLTLDSDQPDDVDVNVDIVAEQGNESNGIIRYDDGNNRWELSNDGGGFAAIATGSTASTLATAQMRETGGFVISNGSFADVDFDVVDEESNSSIVDADVSTDDFTVLEDGYYLVSYDFTLQNDVIAAVDGRVFLNGSTVLNGSEGSTGTHTAVPTGNELSQTFVVQLSTNDTLTMQTQTAVAANDMNADGVFVIVKLEGVQGEVGPAGPAATLDEAYDEGGPGSGRQILLDSGAFDLQGIGEVIELGTGSAADVFLNFDDGVDRQLGWDDSLTSFSTFDQQLSFRVVQSASPPVACSSTVTGMQWFDTDTGITYVCDTSNSRNKWLSIGEFNITGGESASCAAGASTGDGCIQDIHNGTDANELGWQMIRDATIVAGSFHSDASCTDGTGVALEVREGDNGTLNLLGNVLTSCTDANGCSATGVNIDVDADQIIRGVLNNSCVSGSVTDWSNIFVVRWRHD